MIIRPERQGDERAIAHVTEDAFRDVEYSDRTEHLIVARLRAAGALVVSLVAEDSEGIIGHVGFSPVTLSSGESGWFCLAPLSVAPERQGQGVGSRLVQEGLAALDRLSASGCVVAGDPDYYGRFGFRHLEGLSAAGIPDEYFTVLRLHGGTPSGIVGFHPGFDGENA
ncbi:MULTISPECIES: GNAT family N-acetyltransferase [Rhizobium/Agrobacterium group]|uniref:GNAT family N-acetyltransferase n=1 Tax=Rhizobium/Agrobacterium group TaxID=227290 RepID=UPI002300220D|nr:MULTISPECIES: N-acetyltransferase [Rhizobium/Agrobacterium group]MDA5633126.1 N-acetyltransferase [Agrobacterium sp. ST15.16.024]MDF1890946.1 N-acetyltransferase [Rhizobium rhizogenes]